MNENTNVKSLASQRIAFKHRAVISHLSKFEDVDDVEEYIEMFGEDELPLGCVMPRTYKALRERIATDVESTEEKAEFYISMLLECDGYRISKFSGMNGAVQVYKNMVMELSKYKRLHVALWRTVHLGGKSSDSYTAHIVDETASWSLLIDGLCKVKYADAWRLLDGYDLHTSGRITEQNYASVDNFLC